MFIIAPISRVTIDILGFPSERIPALATYPTIVAGNPIATILKYSIVYLEVFSLPPNLSTNPSIKIKTKIPIIVETIVPKQIAFPK